MYNSKINLLTSAEKKKGVQLRHMGNIRWAGKDKKIKIKKKIKRKKRKKRKKDNHPLDNKKPMVNHI